MLIDHYLVIVFDEYRWTRSSTYKSFFSAVRPSSPSLLTSSTRSLSKIFSFSRWPSCATHTFLNYRECPALFFQCSEKMEKRYFAWDHYEISVSNKMAYKKFSFAKRNIEIIEKSDCYIKIHQLYSFHKFFCYRLKIAWKTLKML